MVWKDTYQSVNGDYFWAVTLAVLWAGREYLLLVLCSSTFKLLTTGILVYYTDKNEWMNLNSCHRTESL